jgi:anaerobic ribonucleoside-triphosphate reductase activating protein
MQPTTFRPTLDTERPREEAGAAREVVLSRFAASTAVLGPGRRAVVWVHGCPLRCPGCIAPEDLPFEGGRRWPVPALAARLAVLPPAVTGLTLSGGEPMAQAGALAELVDLIRTGRDWSVMAFTGFTLERLRGRGDAGQRALLDRLDILVDGPYVQSRHADLLWRGSVNQRVHFLTDRHTPPDEDRGAGIEVSVAGGALRWTGVPPVPGFRDRFESAMARQGASLVANEEL